MKGRTREKDVDVFAALSSVNSTEDSSLQRQRHETKAKKQQQPQQFHRAPGRKPSKPVATLEMRSKPQPGVLGGTFAGEAVSFIAPPSAAPTEHPHQRAKPKVAKGGADTKKLRRIRPETFGAELSALWGAAAKERADALASVSHRLDEHCAASDVDGSNDEADARWPAFAVDAALRVQLVEWVARFSDDAAAAELQTLCQGSERSLWLSRAGPRLLLHAIAAAKPHVVAAAVPASTPPPLLAWLSAQVAFGSTAIAAWMWLERVAPTAVIGSDRETSAQRSGEFIARAAPSHRSDVPPLGAALLAATLAKPRAANIARPVSRLCSQLCSVETLLPATGDPSALFCELVAMLGRSPALARAACDCLLAAPDSCFVAWVGLHSALHAQSTALLQHMASLSAANLRRIGPERLSALVSELRPAAREEEEEGETQVLDPALEALSVRLKDIASEKRESTGKHQQDNDDDDKPADSSKHASKKKTSQGGCSKCAISVGVVSFVAASAVGAMWLANHCCSVPLCAKHFC